MCSPSAFEPSGMSPEALVIAHTMMRTQLAGLYQIATPERFGALVDDAHVANGCVRAAIEGTHDALGGEIERRILAGQLTAGSMRAIADRTRDAMMVMA